jgi:DNA (cytosine-5)-methyltransferase 1
LHAYLRLVRTTLPKVLVLENVSGLAFDGKDEGLKLMQSGLRKINADLSTRYLPQLLTINAADYGVPQLRERVFLLATIDGRQITLPKPTHGIAGNDYLTAWDAIGNFDVTPWPEELNPAGRWAGLLPSIPEGRNYLWHTPRNEDLGGQPLFGWRTKYWSFLLKLAKARPSWTIQAVPGPATGPFHWKSRLLAIEELARLP